VHVGKSRSEIDRLLRDWGCDGIRWTDSFSQGLAALEFIWVREDIHYLARFTLHLPTDDELRASALNHLENEIAKLRSELEALGQEGAA